ncbi:MAG: deoxyribose-phosphate aldolase [Candidatus Bipolaricaulota bacterium]
MSSSSPGQAPNACRLVDYTDLRKEITYDDVEVLCMEALGFPLRAVVVPSALVRAAVRALRGRVAVSCPISYPFGTQSPSVKAVEAAAAVEAGATELEIVPHFASLRSQRWETTRAELDQIARSARGATLKLVLEATALDAETLRRTCAIALDAGYSFVSNTIGFRLVSTQPETVGAASATAVRDLVGLVPPGLRVKAVGGATSWAEVDQLHRAGAERVAVLAKRGILSLPLEGAP